MHVETFDVTRISHDESEKLAKREMATWTWGERIWVRPKENARPITKQFRHNEVGSSTKLSELRVIILTDLPSNYIIN